VRWTIPALRDLESILYFESYVVVDPGDAPVREREIIKEALRRADGKEDVILRSNIATLRSTSLSLMPSGSNSFSFMICGNGFFSRRSRMSPLMHGAALE